MEMNVHHLFVQYIQPLYLSLHFCHHHRQTEWVPLGKLILYHFCYFFI
jgi:hypothetical protein